MPDPIIYKVENEDSYLIFGEFHGGYDLKRIQEQLELMKKQGLTKENTEVENEEEIIEIDAEKGVESEIGEGLETLDEIKGEKEIDDSALKENDIEMLMTQFEISRKEAIHALVESDYDCIEAMVKLEDKKK